MNLRWNKITCYSYNILYSSDLRFFLQQIIFWSLEPTCSPSSTLCPDIGGHGFLNNLEKLIFNMFNLQKGKGIHHILMWKRTSSLSLSFRVIPVFVGCVYYLSQFHPITPLLTWIVLMEVYTNLRNLRNIREPLGQLVTVWLVGQIYPSTRRNVQLQVSGKPQSCCN